jgi:hypothetical protein
MAALSDVDLDDDQTAEYYLAFKVLVVGSPFTGKVRMLPLFTNQQDLSVLNSLRLFIGFASDNF